MTLQKQITVMVLFHGQKGSKIRHSGVHYLKRSNNKCIIMLYNINHNYNIFLTQTYRTAHSH